MPSTRDIRRRIKSVKNTAQITKAMQMVAASKMRKAQQAALAGRPFAQLLYRIQRSATADAGDFTHPLLEEREVRKRARHPDRAPTRGCAARSTPTSSAWPRSSTRSTTVFITAGRKAAQFVARTQAPARRGVHLQGHAAVHRGAGDCRRSPATCSSRARWTRWTIVATRFINTLTQEPVRRRVPAGRRDHGGCRSPGARTGGGAGRRTRRSTCSSRAPSDVLGSLLPHYLNIYRLPGPARSQGERAERAHGGDEERHRQRQAADQGPDARIQQAAPGQHHQGTAGNRQRPAGAAADDSNQI